MKKIIILFICIVTFTAYILNKHETKHTSAIDSTLQVKAISILENKLSELNALSGQAIIMEVQTGQIEAMVGLERKDSANYQPCGNLPQKQALGLIQPLSILAALETGKVKLSDTVDVGNGIYSTNEIEIKDHNWHRGGYGTITIQQGLAVSSEIATYKTIEKAFGSEQAYQAQLNKMEINLDSLNTLEMLTLYNEIAKNGNIAPEQEQYTCSTHQCTHNVHHSSYLRRIACKLTEKICCKHEERCARGMTNFQFISCCYKFGTIPKTGGRLYGRAISKSCNHKCQPSNQIVNLIVLFHVSCFISH